MIRADFHIMEVLHSSQNKIRLQTSREVTLYLCVSAKLLLDHVNIYVTSTGPYGSCAALLDISNPFNQNISDV